MSGAIKIISLILSSLALILIIIALFSVIYVNSRSVMFIWKKKFIYTVGSINLDQDIIFTLNFEESRSVLKDRKEGTVLIELSRNLRIKDFVKLNDKYAVKIVPHDGGFLLLAKEVNGSTTLIKFMKLHSIWKAKGNFLDVTAHDNRIFILEKTNNNCAISVLDGNGHRTKSIDCPLGNLSRTKPLKLISSEKSVYCLFHDLDSNAILVGRVSNGYVQLVGNISLGSASIPWMDAMALDGGLLISLPNCQLIYLDENGEIRTHHLIIPNLPKTGGCSAAIGPHTESNIYLHGFYGFWGFVGIWDGERLKRVAIIPPEKFSVASSISHALLSNGELYLSGHFQTSGSEGVFILRTKPDLTEDLGKILDGSETVDLGKILGDP